MLQALESSIDTVLGGRILNASSGLIRISPVEIRFSAEPRTRISSSSLGDQLNQIKHSRCISPFMILPADNTDL